MKRGLIAIGLALMASLTPTFPVMAHAPSGAIFTTLPDGSQVNVNLFPSKDKVYLDGGPGPGAPATAAGLDDGTYVFQVTNPSGKTLLSTDPARCRQFTVSGGFITGVVVAGGCQHATGIDKDHGTQGARTVQLIPFNDTPNPGGVYKAWVTRVEDYLLGCSARGVSNGLDVVDCGYAAGNLHGFLPAHSKVDNFKVKMAKIITEIDVFFFNDRNGDGHRQADTEELLAGMVIIWTDTNGATNVKFTDPAYGYAARVEQAEEGVNYITIGNQTGCTVGLIHRDDFDQGSGPQTIAIDVPGSPKIKDWSTTLLVACTP